MRPGRSGTETPMHIHLVPDGGLCNRMRAVDSAIALARERNWELTVHWRQHRGILNCRFDRLFEPIPGLELREVRGMPPGFDDSLRSRVLRFMTSGRSVSRAESATFFAAASGQTDLSRSKALYIVSYSRFHPNVDQYSDFRPTEEVRQLVDRETRAFTAHTIGMHIRRTDNKKSIEHSPLELFEEAIERELAIDPRADFYVASDSTATKQRLLDRFGPRILCNLSEPDRDSPEGVVQAAVELYALARTCRIYGSYWSSFSHTAAHIGHIPEITVTKEAFPAS
jgi:hypothetical protein